MRIGVDVFCGDEAISGHDCLGVAAEVTEFVGALDTITAGDRVTDELHRVGVRRRGHHELCACHRLKTEEGDIPEEAFVPADDTHVVRPVREAGRDVVRGHAAGGLERVGRHTVDDDLEADRAGAVERHVDSGSVDARLKAAA